jgi:hypothetical protein
MGVVAGLLGWLLGILTYGIIFVPLAILCAAAKGDAYVTGAEPSAAEHSEA